MNGENDHTNVLKQQDIRFEDLYISLRRLEKRIYSDEEVAWLPDVEAGHRYQEEWKIRKTSSSRLIRYLGKKKVPLKILEVGCGNGWLCYHLSQIPGSMVTGIDINLIELEQAKRVFADLPDLWFIHSDLFTFLSRGERFDIVIFAASIQYFDSFEQLMRKLMACMNEGGEVHIIDSHFYSDAQIEAAKQSSAEYFARQGFDKMQSFYFHRTLGELNGFRFSFMDFPRRLLGRMLLQKNPFHWIRITK